MKKYILFLSLVCLLVSCQQEEIIKNTKKIETRTLNQEQEKIENKKDSVSFLEIPIKIEKTTEYSNAISKVAKFSFQNKPWEVLNYDFFAGYTRGKCYLFFWDNKYFSSDTFCTQKNDLEWYKIESTFPQTLQNFLKPYFTIEKNIFFEKNGKKYTLNLQPNQPTFYFEKEFFTPVSVTKNTHFYKEKPGNKYSDFYKNIEKKAQKNPNFFKTLSEKQKQQYFSEEDKVAFFENKSIFLKLPDNSLLSYSIDIPFLAKKDENIFDIQLKNSRQILKDYTYSWKFFSKVIYDFNGIFDVKVENPNKTSPRYLSLKENYTKNDLQIIGTSKNGEKIWGFKNPNHPVLKILYQSYLSGQKMKKEEFTSMEDAPKMETLSYKNFIKTVPVFFWEDPFERLIVFVKDGYPLEDNLPLAGKPVIYLYPEKTQKIQVYLKWEKQNLITIPKYQDMWEVEAKPNGTLIHDKKTYPYLFWEDYISLPKKHDGFVISTQEVPIFLWKKLTYLGLNQQEIKDFTDFWLPKFDKKYPYYFIRFYTTETMDEQAPITIIPKPDSIQRIFMDYQWLTKKIPIQKQILQKFERKGFSVIEWWGNLKK